MSEREPVVSWMAVMSQDRLGVAVASNKAVIIATEDGWREIRDRAQKALDAIADHRKQQPAPEVPAMPAPDGGAPKKGDGGDYGPS